MKDECLHPPCPAGTHRAGYCSIHYRRKLRGGDMDSPRWGSEDPRSRFWRKADKTAGCWRWTAFRRPDGYGQFKLNGRQQLAHRVAWEWENGPIPDGMSIDHMCHNRGCVNPGHLRLVTHAENLQNYRGAYRSSKSGIRGVSKHGQGDGWVAHAKLNGRQHYLGYFADVEEAERAVTDWRREHMPYSIMDQERKGAA